MPCYRCGTRQVDPDRGASPWLRGVRSHRQVLICPGCQAGPGWPHDLDTCPVCASIHLVRRLGEVECRDCGYVADPGHGTGEPVGLIKPDAPEPGSGDLAEEVEQALARVLRRLPRPAGIG
jgi:hypothetical protein